MWHQEEKDFVGIATRISEAQLGGNLVVELQHGRQPRTGRDSSAPEGPKSGSRRWKRSEAGLRDGMELGWSAVCQA